MDLKKYEKFYESLGLREPPLGIFYADKQPEKGLTAKEGAHVCMIGMLQLIMLPITIIMPLRFIK